MSDKDIDATRAAFAEFERDMTADGAVAALREGLDYALDIIEGDYPNTEKKQVAQNLVNSYLRKLIEKIETIVRDPGSFEDDYYWQWVSLVSVFEEAGYAQDNGLSGLKGKLWVKMFKTWGKEQRSALLEDLQHNL